MSESESKLLSNPAFNTHYLKEVATIPVYSDSGVLREIQLCIGDITALAPENKVDVILVSAFYQSYAPTPGTVIRALHKFGISVERLSKDKAGDLRAPFNCWWSKALEDGVPYRQLLCFETSNAISHAAQQVNNVFRCLMVICKSSGTSVITPLLSTGNQCADRRKMLTAIVDGAVHWMKAGLPLKSLRIVLYDSHSQSTTRLPADIQDCLLGFEELKHKYEPFCKLPEIHTLSVDFYISHSEADGTLAHDLMTKLLCNLEGIGTNVTVTTTTKSKSDGIEYNENEVWQQHMYNYMAQCRTIITLLSVSYMSSPTCIEEYNIAMCLMRNESLRPSRKLAPLYLQRIPAIPSYMTSIQWLDCKDYDEHKIQQACEQLLQKESSKDSNASYSYTPTATASDIRNPVDVTLTTKYRGKDTNRDLQLFRQLSVETKYYDIFISYAHKDSEMANVVLETIKTRNPNLKTFFDRDELKTGMLWQHTMFEGTENCRCMLAIITHNYLNSLVCNEELCVGISRWIMRKVNDDNDPFHLQLLYIDDSLQKSVDWLQFLPSQCVTLAKASDKTKEQLQHLVDKLASTPSIDSLHRHQSKIEIDCNVPDVLEMYRKSHALSYLHTLVQPTDSNSIFKNCEIHSTSDQTYEENHIDIVYLHCDSEEGYVRYLNEMIETQFGNAVRTSLDEKFKNVDELHLLDVTNYIVVLLSCKYILSTKLMQQLHVALIKARKKKVSRNMLYLIQIDKLPQRPHFLHLLNYGVVCHDKIWSVYSHEYYMINNMTQASVYLAFGKACYDICTMMTLPNIAVRVRDDEDYGLLLNVNKITTQLNKTSEKNKILEASAVHKECMPRELSKLVNDGKLLSVTDNTGNMLKLIQNRHNVRSGYDTNGGATITPAAPNAAKGSGKITRFRKSKACSIL